MLIKINLYLQFMLALNYYYQTMTATEALWNVALIFFFVRKRCFQNADMTHDVHSSYGIVSSFDLAWACKSRFFEWGQTSLPAWISCRRWAYQFCNDRSYVTVFAKSQIVKSSDANEIVFSLVCLASQCLYVTLGSAGISYRNIEFITKPRKIMRRTMTSL